MKVRIPISIKLDIGFNEMFWLVIMAIIWIILGRTAEWLGLGMMDYLAVITPVVGTLSAVISFRLPVLHFTPFQMYAPDKPVDQPTHQNGLPFILMTLSLIAAVEARLSMLGIAPQYSGVRMLAITILMLIMWPDALDI